MQKNTVKNIVSAGATLAAESLKNKARHAEGWLGWALWLAAAVCVGVAALTSASSDQQQPAQEEPPAIVSPADPADAR